MSARKVFLDRNHRAMQSFDFLSGAFFFRGNSKLNQIQNLPIYHPKLEQILIYRNVISQNQYLRELGHIPSIPDYVNCRPRTFQIHQNRPKLRKYNNRHQNTCIHNQPITHFHLIENFKICIKPPVLEYLVLVWTIGFQPFDE